MIAALAALADMKAEMMVVALAETMMTIADTVAALADTAVALPVADMTAALVDTVVALPVAEMMVAEMTVALADTAVALPVADMTAVLVDTVVALVDTVVALPVAEMTVLAEMMAALAMLPAVLAAPLYTRNQQHKETQVTRFKKILEKVKPVDVAEAERSLSAGSCVKPDLKLFKE
ncbi:hypothetical protein LPJ62_000417 [Coemansia sp. RSA 2167]|nr:hypothetical protein LPJ62_000417 [Coemansia sp. RSA 2167]